jgi:hypothetical protein
MQIQLVIVSPECSVSLVFAKSFIVAMERMCPGSFHYLPLIVVSLQDDATSMTADAEKFRISLNTSATSLSSLGAFIENTKGHFKSDNVKTVFVSMIHAVNGGPSQRGSSQRQNTLHHDAYRFLWSVARCSHNLREVAGDEAVCELVFAPPNLDDALKTELVKLVGPVTCTAASVYNGVAPVPSVFATPGACAIMQSFRKSEYETQPLDGWAVPAEPQVPADVTGGLITFIAKTSEIVVFQERPLTEVEQRTVEAFTMTHQETGERRLCSRDWWLRWYGHVKTPLQSMLCTQHPCHPVIFAVTGSPAPAGIAGVEACGKQRYCTSCENVFKYLDGTYCLPVMVDATVALMTKARQLWAAGQDDVAFRRNTEVNRLHDCNAACALIN